MNRLVLLAAIAAALPACLDRECGLLGTVPPIFNSPMTLTTAELAGATVTLCADTACDTGTLVVDSLIVLTGPFAATAQLTSTPDAYNPPVTATYNGDITQHPATFRFTLVAHDGTPLLDQYYRATYSEAEVNGAGCGDSTFVMLTPE
jgi:hypothetical protein